MTITLDRLRMLAQNVAREEIIRDRLEAQWHRLDRNGPPFSDDLIVAGHALHTQERKAAKARHDLADAVADMVNEAKAQIVRGEKE